MSWIREEPVDGPTANISNVVSINPKAREAMGLIGRAVRDCGLTKIQEEAIATTVSVLNHCKY
jgi:hypothetical protein